MGLPPPTCPTPDPRLSPRPSHNVESKCGRDLHLPLSTQHPPLRPAPPSSGVLALGLVQLGPFVCVQDLTWKTTFWKPFCEWFFFVVVLDPENFYNFSWVSR